jgi:hypothetical protein
MAVAGGFAAADGAVAIVGAGCAASGFVVAGADAGCAVSGFVVAGADAGCAASGVAADTCFLGTAAPPEGVAVVPASTTAVLAVSLPAMAAVPLFAGSAPLGCPTCAAAGPVSEPVAGFGASALAGECRVGIVCPVGVAEC